MRMRPDGGQIFIGGYDMCNQNSCFGGSSCCWIIIAIILLFLFIAVVPGIQLTLPGIAGIILAIGMGVDANVITAERIKEELAKNKTLPAAVKSGFKMGLTPIIDGNVTIVIVAIVAKCSIAADIDNPHILGIVCGIGRRKVPSICRLTLFMTGKKHGAQAISIFGNIGQYAFFERRWKDIGFCDFVEKRKIFAFEFISSNIIRNLTILCE